MRLTIFIPDIIKDERGVSAGVEPRVERRDLSPAPSQMKWHFVQRCQTEPRSAPSEQYEPPAAPQLKSLVMHSLK